MSSSIPKIEEIVLDKSNAGLGFNIRGGVDNIHIGSDPGIFVTTVKPNGAAAKDGRLQPGDKILEINGNDLRESEHGKAVNHFHASGEIVTLLVERGAEQRIREQLEISALSKPVQPQSSRQVARRGVSWFSYFMSWAPAWGTLLLLGVGGGSILLIWYLRKRRHPI